MGGYQRGAPLVAGQLVEGDPYPTSALPVLGGWGGGGGDNLYIQSVVSSVVALTTCMIGCGILLDYHAMVQGNDLV